MIDAIKIEEATKDYINKNNYFAKYEEDSCVDIEFAYKDGAHWAINESLKDLWHQSSEKPKKGHVFLYKTIFKGYGVNQIIDGNEWKYIIKHQKATQWLYIDDLLPKNIATYSNDELKIPKNLLTKVLGMSQSK